MRKAYTRTVYVDRDFQRKTNKLVQDNVGTYGIGARELRKKVTFALLAETDDVDRVATIVNSLFSLLDKVGKI